MVSGSLLEQAHRVNGKHMSGGGVALPGFGRVVVVWRRDWYLREVKIFTCAGSCSEAVLASLRHVPRRVTVTVFTVVFAMVLSRGCRFG